MLSQRRRIRGIIVLLVFPFLLSIFGYNFINNYKEESIHKYSLLSGIVEYCTSDISDLNINNLTMDDLTSNYLRIKIIDDFREIKINIQEQKTLFESHVKKNDNVQIWFNEYQLENNDRVNYEIKQLVVNDSVIFPFEKSKFNLYFGIVLFIAGGICFILLIITVILFFRDKFQKKF